MTSLSLLAVAFFSSTAMAGHPKITKAFADTNEAPLSEECYEVLKVLPGNTSLKDLQAACEKVQTMDGCKSAQGTRIFHFDKIGTEKNPKRILAKALIHGDEMTAGVVARAWMERLNKIDPRNTWRVIPIANPDGLKANTRYNANGVDLNRNFPTANWDNEALAYWKKNMRSDKRRYPGPSSASEPETKCLVKQFDDFKPDFIISIHTPLGVLDLDGPKLKSLPSFHPLPWLSLGNFPGSLGRYMWMDRKIPVLTIELKRDTGVSELEQFDRLQDISGTVAIQAAQLKDKDQAARTKDKDSTKN